MRALHSHYVAERRGGEARRMINSIQLLAEWFKGRNGTFNPPQQFGETWTVKNKWLLNRFGLQINEYTKNGVTVQIICEGERINNWYNYQIRPTKFPNIFLGKYHSDTSNNIPNLLRRERCEEWCRTHLH